MDTLIDLLPFLVPILLLQIALMVVALVDLIRRERTRGPKWVWAVVIVFFNILGPVIYLVAGREE
ncbi:MAG: PLD nuclease N-terminal domain-containing protein [Anaerolineae bacterium]|nr:PLD nuclease N-terminal domain-containing protein [Anaerolineae bacterium]